MRIQALALAVIAAFAALAGPLARAQTARAQPALAQTVDLGVMSLEVRGDPGRPGGQLAVTARIRRLDRGPPDSVIAILRFQSPGEPRAFAERRVPLAPGERAAVTVPWTARAGRHVVSVSVAVGTNQAVDRQPRNDSMTTRDIVVFARGGRDAPREEPPTAVTLPAMSMASAPAAAVVTSALSALSAPSTALATGALSLRSAPAAIIAVPALTSMSAPALAIDTEPLGAQSRPAPDQPNDQPADQPSDQSTGDQPARQP
jgi:hypothetical protein